MEVHEVTLPVTGTPEGAARARRTLMDEVSGWRRSTVTDDLHGGTLILKGRELGIGYAVATYTPDHWVGRTALFSGTADTTTDALPPELVSVRDRIIDVAVEETLFDRCVTATMSRALGILEENGRCRTRADQKTRSGRDLGGGVPAL